MRRVQSASQVCGHEPRQRRSAAAPFISPPIPPLALSIASPIQSAPAMQTAAIARPCQAAPRAALAPALRRSPLPARRAARLVPRANPGVRHGRAGAWRRVGARRRAGAAAHRPSCGRLCHVTSLPCTTFKYRARVCTCRTSPSLTRSRTCCTLLPRRPGARGAAWRRRLAAACHQPPAHGGPC